MKREFEKPLRTFLLEFVVYGVVVAGYYLLVLHYLGHWLSTMFHQQRVWYAVVTLGLIAGQGILLDLLTRALVAWIGPRTED